jgi:hypothetical protein
MSVSSLPEYSAALREFIRQTANGRLDGVTADNEFNRLALSLFAWQYEHNAAYRRCCETRQVTPGQLADWRQIPPIPTAAFKEFELTSLLPAARARVFHSSGTTAHQPSRHFHSTESLRLYEASLSPWFQKHLLPELTAPRTDRQPVHFLSLIPAPEQAPHSSLAHMFETVRREFGSAESIFCGAVNEAGDWSVNLEAAIATLTRWSCADQPIVLLGTAFSFVQFLDHLDAKQLSLPCPARSRVLETGGYKGRSRALPKPELHAGITRHLGIAAEWIVSEYGMSELSSQAYDRAAGATDAAGHFQFPPWARVRIVSPEDGREIAPGEPGIVQVFDLANAASVLAVQTEDLGVRRENGFELCGRAAATEPRGCSLMAH